MIYDICTYNRESELFEIRHNILKDFVDEFRVVEFDQTFSGRKKEKQFNQNWDKVKHYFITEDIWSKYWEEAKKSPNTDYGKGAEHWLREWAMKESICDCLLDLDDDDIVFVGDTDEIWQHDAIYNDAPLKLKLRVYSYWLNNRSSEEFWGTLRAKYKDIKNECLNHLRTNTKKGLSEYGWHFTSQGGYEEVKRKLSDSYTEDSYWNPSVQAHLEENMAQNRDFLGRDFTYTVDESEWPAYLQENRQKYKHLLK